MSKNLRVKLISYGLGVVSTLEIFNIFLIKISPKFFPRIGVFTIDLILEFNGFLFHFNNVNIFRIEPFLTLPAPAYNSTAYNSTAY